MYYFQEKRWDRHQSLYFKMAVILSLTFVVGLSRLEVFANTYGELSDRRSEEISEFMAHMENPIKSKKIKKDFQKQRKKIEEIVINLDSTDLEPEVDTTLITEPISIKGLSTSHIDSAFKESTPIVEPIISDESPVLIAQQMPIFGPCSFEVQEGTFTACSNQEVLKYLAKHIKYPKLARDSNLEGMVIAEIIIDTKGAVTKPIVLRGIGHGCDEEVLRVLQQMPDWRPGRHNGRAVKVLMRIPVRFRLAK